MPVDHGVARTVRVRAGATISDRHGHGPTAAQGRTDANADVRPTRGRRRRRERSSDGFIDVVVVVVVIHVVRRRTWTVTTACR